MIARLRTHLSTRKKAKGKRQKEKPYPYFQFLPDRIGFQVSLALPAGPFRSYKIL
jgi:hypothetical protein